MNIVFGSHTYFSPVFVVGSHHLARVAARSMHRVWHVSAAVSLLHLPLVVRSADHRRRVGLACSKARLVEPRLWETVPLTYVPWEMARRGLRPEASYLKGPRSLTRSARRLGFSEPDLLLIDEPRMAALVPLLRPRVTIYRPTDVYSAFKGDATLVAVERRLLKQVDGVIGTSTPVLEHVQTLGFSLPTLLLENGADLAHFSEDRPKPEELKRLDRPIAIYVGAVDHRFSADVLHHAASHNPSTTFLVIGGDEPNGVRVTRPDNVRYLGRRPYEQIPAYLQHSDFAVMPLSDARANSGRSPMKIFEFAAAGLSVVATETAELRRRNLPFVELASSPDEFASACQRAARTSDDTTRERARKSAALHGWDAKFAKLLSFAEALS